MNHFLYQKESLAQRRLLLAQAFHSTGSAPVYSGDVAVALQLPHWQFKDRIEASYPVLRYAYEEVDTRRLMVFFFL